MRDVRVQWGKSPPGEDPTGSDTDRPPSCAGIYACDVGRHVILRPLTGKGYVARGCSIILPAAAATLREIAAGLTRLATGIEGELTPTTVHPDEHILRVLDMSTCHLSQASRDWLQEREQGEQRKLPVVAATDYGWLLWVPEPGDEPVSGGIASHGPTGQKPWPADVRRILRFAQARRCAYLLLDADGPAWDGLWSSDDGDDPDATATTPACALLPNGGTSAWDERLRTVGASTLRLV